MTTVQAGREQVVCREHNDLVIRSKAVYNTAETHRYLLTRRWQPGGRTAVFVMLNPSTATEKDNDPSDKRCLERAIRWGCNAYTIVNLFGLRATDPWDLYDHDDPVGERNDEFITQHCAEWQAPGRPGRIVVVAWGVHGDLHGRAQAVTSALISRGVRLQCLGTTQKGQPRHPLYMAYATPLVRYQP